ncbi:radical SAM family heme chaperone HemW [Flavobacteriales bacterium]|nr:radical SAM family heme chaperone HemW [Flavobacteriales bacterium]MDA7794605.1 radical SAM family heme chaperone HemW [Flavobacteriales bacterium]
MSGIYIHIPFCKQQCNYCDFHFSTSLNNKNEVLNAIVSEMKKRSSFLEGTKIRTIYFGGGTPSILSTDKLNAIFEHLNAQFNLSDVNEITMEANPDDLTPEKIKALSKTPINRFSIGIQSFQNEDLKYMNRAHNVEQAKSSIKSVQDAGWENITIDLIYGTPTLNNDMWLENMQHVIDFEIPHLSAYGLTVEEKTPLFHAIKKGHQKPLDEQKSKTQFEMLMDFIPENGLEQYEISNFAKEGFEAKHNGSYWTDDIYLGLGPSAHSFDGKRRLWNISNNILYIKSLQNNELPQDFEELTEVQRYNEYLLTSLRTKKGVDIEYAKSRFSPFLIDFFNFSVKKWMLSGEITEKEGFFTLTKKGKIIADYLSSDLFYIE